jgi:hypothetical protein
MPTETEITLAAVRMLTDYRAKDGRRFHPDDTLAMIRTIIDNRHPDLDWEGQGAKAERCNYCDDRGYYFNEKSWDPEWMGQIPDFDNGGFSLCVCPRADDVDLTEMPTHPDAT